MPIIPKPFRIDTLPHLPGTAAVNRPAPTRLWVASSAEYTARRGRINEETAHALADVGRVAALVGIYTDRTADLLAAARAETVLPDAPRPRRRLRLIRGQR
jgi:hypothetical protein